MARPQIIVPGNPRRSGPRPLSSRTQILLDEVASCTSEMDGLQKKMGFLRAELRQPEEDAALLEAERNLAEYLQVQRGKTSRDSPGKRRTTGEWLLSLAEAVASPVSASVDGGVSLVDYLPGGEDNEAGAGEPLQESRSSGRGFAERRGKRGCPAASVWHRTRQPARSTVLPRCDCNVRLLEPHVTELAKLVERREAEVKELLREFWGKCVASPDLGALAAENETLARRACENAEQVGSLRVEGAAIIRAVDVDQQWTQELQAERRTLLERIGGLEHLEVPLYGIRDGRLLQLGHFLRQPCILRTLGELMNFLRQQGTLQGLRAWIEATTTWIGFSFISFRLRPEVSIEL